MSADENDSGKPSGAFEALFAAAEASIDRLREENAEDSTPSDEEEAASPHSATEAVETAETSIPKPAPGTLEAQLAALPSARRASGSPMGRANESNPLRAPQSVPTPRKARVSPPDPRPSNPAPPSPTKNNDIDAAVKQSLIRARNEVSELLEKEQQSHAATRKEFEAQKLRIATLKKNLETARERGLRERNTAVASAREKLLKAFLPVLDNLERAVSVAVIDDEMEPATKSLIEGVRNVLDLFRANLATFGVQAYSAIGETFDPNQHEAIRRIEDPTRYHNEVVEEYHKGYLIDDRLLRAALVVVASGGGPPPAAASDDDDSDTPL
ncbi:MAG: nucleotide exchange factor GrpE [Myxococcota bacterium]|nr:nucleotide exchange factor GrpE [Myxococcota bacterium]